MMDKKDWAVLAAAAAAAETWTAFRASKTDPPPQPKRDFFIEAGAGETTAAGLCCVRNSGPSLLCAISALPEELNSWEQSSVPFPQPRIFSCFDHTIYFYDEEAMEATKDSISSLIHLGAWT